MTSKMDKLHFNLKFTAKHMEREAKRCEKAEKDEKSKLKKAIQKGNTEGARIHAENAIRQKNQNLNFLRIAARVDAVSQRVKEAATMQKVTKDMSGVTKAMDQAMKSMSLEKIQQVMDKFEKSFEDLDVQTNVMDDAMKGTTTLNTPEGQVNNLMQEVADEAGLELNMELPSAGTSTAIGASTASTEQDDLTIRLAKLRNRELEMQLADGGHGELVRNSSEADDRIVKDGSIIEDERTGEDESVL